MEQQEEKKNGNTQNVLFERRRNKWILIWSFISLVLWCIYTCFQYTDIENGYQLGLIIIPHFVFLALLIVYAVIFYKIYKTQSAVQEKADEYERRKKLEELQSENYKKRHDDNAELEQKIENVFKSLMEKQETNYKENLKTLEANLKLYNDVKQIVEGESPKKERKTITQKS
jgi:uncharacterized membrane protein